MWHNQQIHEYRSDNPISNEEKISGNPYLIPPDLFAICVKSNRNTIIGAYNIIGAAGIYSIPVAISAADDNHRTISGHRYAYSVYFCPFYSRISLYK